MFKKSILAAALVAASMSAALPAAAQNALSLTLNATNAEEANAIRSGLTLFSLVQGAQSGAFVNQNGWSVEPALAVGDHHVQKLHHRLALGPARDAADGDPTARPPPQARGVDAGLADFRWTRNPAAGLKAKALASTRSTSSTRKSCRPPSSRISVRVSSSTTALACQRRHAQRMQMTPARSGRASQIRSAGGNVAAM
jgi:hypothetical protein